VADTAEEPVVTTSDVSPAKPTPVRVGAWPMWVLGLVVLIDQVDQNLVRGVVRAAFVGAFSATDLWAAVAEARAPGSTPEPELGQIN